MSTRSYLGRRCAVLSFVLLVLCGLACSGDPEPGQQAADPPRRRTTDDGAQSHQPVTELHRLVVDAFYGNNPVTYQPEPPEVTAARQQQARERIKGLSDSEIQQIGKLLQHENGTVTGCAAQALSLLGERAAVAVPDLIAALDLPGSEHRRARAYAMRILGNLGAPALVAKERLQQQLSHSDSRDREAAQEALALLTASDPSNPGGAIRPLLLAMAAPGHEKKAAAAKQLHARDKQELAADLLHLLQEDPNGTVRMMAAGLLGNIAADDPSIVPALQQGLQDEDNHVQRKSAESLGKMGAAAKPAVPALIEAMQAAESFHVSTYITALGEIGPEAAAAVPIFIENLSGEPSPADFMRTDATIKALGNIGPAAHEAVPVLIERLRSSDPHDQKDIAETLGKIGPAAADAVPILQKLQDHFVVNDAAVEALRRIQPNQDPLVAGPADDPAEQDKPADPAQAVERAKLFFTTLEQGDLPALRAMLTVKARANYATGGVGSMTITVPDEAELSFGKPHFKEDAVAVPVTIKAGELTVATHLFLRGEFGQWRVYGYRFPDEDGRSIMMNLEDKEAFMREFLRPPGRDN
ncbi:MAG: HEAT repeat domain-containing protein [Pirellulales bacterium]